MTPLALTVNGRAVALAAEPRTSLADVVRCSWIQRQSSVFANVLIVAASRGALKQVE